MRDDMASVYRERIGDERLKAVADHVRQVAVRRPRRPIVTGWYNGSGKGRE